MARTVAIVPHTHWDREWYLPFQSFRLRLVGLLDELLPRMEADPSYAHFLLDGQLAVVDDYLAVRPEAEPRIRRLATSGRLAIGPWYIQMDEFLVSGETIVRDLQLGFERAAAFGGAMEVGYLPDLFGHVAQMPQLLRLAGLGHAVLWRGVPASVDRTGFDWCSPDGSSVRVEYLAGSYSNGAAVPDDAKALVERIERTIDGLGDRLRPDDPLLWMNGTDHQLPQPWLGRVVAETNDLQDELHLEVVPLAAYLAAAPTDDLPRVEGELRSGARANLLMGVASNRVDIKVAAARAERALERRAEPLSALFVPADRWPNALLAEAWLAVIRNSAHDSICGCSHDDVCLAVLSRYAEARHIADGLADLALEWVAAVVAEPGPVVVNASPRPRAGLVQVQVPGEGELAGTQLLDARPSAVLDERWSGTELGAWLDGWRSQEVVPRTFVERIEVAEDDAVVRVTLHAGPEMIEPMLVAETKAELVGLAAARPDAPFEVRIDQQATRTVLARAEAPGYGWAAWAPAPLQVPPVEAEGMRLSNGLVHLEVDPVDGTFTLDGLRGIGRLVDGGDVGDTYNHETPDGDVVVERPERVEVEVAESGPLRGRLVVDRTYRWPVGATGRTRDAATAEVRVRTILELRAGERFVRVTTELVNPVRDHRLRVHLPLPERAATSEAECAFAVVRRGTSAEGGPNEPPLPTFPSRRFVRAGGLTVAHEGLLEYELVDLDADGTAGELALTLVRATGWLSRIELVSRPLPAGPQLALDGAQVQGRHVLRWAVAVGEIDPYALVDDAFLPLEVVQATGLGDAPLRGSVLEIEGAEVSALVRVGGLLQLRVFNPTSTPATVTLGGRSGWLVDLRGRPLVAFEASFELGPWAIATAQLHEPAPPLVS